ncbi:MAG: inositol monophosphatase family protein [Rhodospirillales bacterium]|nr:inositol monophosphatase family protein [Rhodospirillales bacterium]
MIEPSPAEFIGFAHRLADRAGAICLEHFRATLDVERKGDRSPITIADRSAEEALRAMVAATYPDHGAVGEEFGPHQPDAEFVWVFDPIDGTRAFVSGNPQFGNLLALLQGGVPVLGVINMPAQQERWLGARGRGAQHRDPSGARQVQVRACPRLDQAIFRTQVLMLKEPEVFQRVHGSVGDTLFGGDCFAFAQIASGWLDIVIDAGLGSFDYLPLVNVVEEAGGRITDWSGAPLSLESEGRVLAVGDPALLAQAVELLAA